MQINNNTKTMMSIRIGIAPFAFRLLSLLRFHLETKSIFLESSKSLSNPFSFEKGDW